MVTQFDISLPEPAQFIIVYNWLIINIIFHVCRIPDYGNNVNSYFEIF